MQCDREGFEFRSFPYALAKSYLVLNILQVKVNTRRYTCCATRPAVHENHAQTKESWVSVFDTVTKNQDHGLLDRLKAKTPTITTARTPMAPGRSSSFGTPATTCSA